MSRRGPRNPERSFGTAVGGVLCAVAVLLWWRGRFGNAEVALGVGAALVVLGVTAPSMLRWPAAAWWRGARLLGDVNARIWLTVLFAVVVAPVGLLWRATGRDPLNRRRGGATGWTTYPARYRDRRHFLRMY